MLIEPPREFRGYPVRVRDLVVGERTYRVLGPANYESLVDDPRVVERFEREEFMPYWAEFWPACLLLADEVAAWPRVWSDIARPPVVLEFGCGLGLISLVALDRGCRVISSDWDDDALAFVCESARVSGLPAPETRFLDWQKHYPDLRLDRLVAAEVLYETRSLRPIAEFTRAHLTDDGEALIVDGNRQTADAFESIARHCGLHVEIVPVERPHPESGKPIRGRIFRLRRRLD